MWFHDRLTRLMLSKTTLSGSSRLLQWRFLGLKGRYWTHNIQYSDEAQRFMYQNLSAIWRYFSWIALLRLVMISSKYSSFCQCSFAQHRSNAQNLYSSTLSRVQHVSVVCISKPIHSVIGWIWNVEYVHQTSLQQSMTEAMFLTLDRSRSSCFKKLGLRTKV